MFQLEKSLLLAVLWPWLSGWTKPYVLFCSSSFSQLEYEVPVHPTAIRIYETFNPGGVVAIKALHPQGHWDLLWSTDKPVHLTSSRIFSPPLKVNFHWYVLFTDWIHKLEVMLFHRGRYQTLIFFWQNGQHL